jgi:SAM-dependent methyltransferase
MHWTEEFFDEYYLKSIDSLTGEEQTKKEVDFIISQTGISKEQKILDFACGHGRHAIELSMRGYTDVTGLDLSALYLDMAREESKKIPSPPQFVQENMRKFKETDVYDLIYSLFSSMFYFGDKKNIKILHRIYQALHREGYFLIDYYNPVAFLKKDKKKDWFVTSDQHIVLEQYHHNPISGIITAERIIITPEGKRIKRMFHTRDYSVAELSFHLEEIGFEIINVFGSFNGDPFTLDSPRQIYVLKKPE